VKRLTGLDASFLALETHSSPMHVASLLVIDPAESDFGIDAVRALYEARLDQAPPFRRRLVEVPFGLHHPVWIEDPDFDLDFHIRHIAVPSPGTMTELEDLVSHLIALPLDRQHPLWEVWLIEGLAEGRFALLTKVHHAAIDGTSGEELLLAILDLGPEVAHKEPIVIDWKPEHAPNELELVGYAALSLAQSPLKLLNATRRTIEAGLQIRRTNRRPESMPPPAPFAAPRTSFNDALSPHRRFVTATVSLPEVKRIKHAFDTTVNDVVLALCGGALRHYLDEHGEHPDGAMVAMVPISVRTDDGKGTLGNQVSSALTTLATDIDEPAERLCTISEGMKWAKVQQNAIGAETLQDWVEFAAPAVAARAARLYSRMKVAALHRPLFNVTISNVPGPPFPLYVAGAQVRSTYPIGPIFDGSAINMTVMSYLDNLDFGLNVCPERVPDLALLAEGLHLALDELSKAVDELVEAD
jgi:diacylglycerol O-acyltransferase